MKTHELKIWPRYYDLVASGEKPFEARRDDRGFQVGDFLRLREWDPETKNYSGRELCRKITYILMGGQFGVEPGHCIMGIQ